jgi:hypothetical protein
MGLTFTLPMCLYGMQKDDWTLVTGNIIHEHHLNTSHSLVEVSIQDSEKGKSFYLHRDVVDVEKILVLLYCNLHVESTKSNVKFIVTH